MIGRMNNETVKRYSLAEIAMLILFMMGLAIAHVIVKVRHRVVLSEPIALAGLGLSVSMPSNPGWEYETNWRYESGNNMALVAQQKAGRSLKSDIQWRYHICSTGGTAEEILRRRVGQSDSRIGPINTTTGPVSMRYAIVFPSDGDDPFLLGVVPLDFGRHLELRVTVYRELDFTVAETLLQNLAASIHYEKPPMLEAGKELLSRFFESLQTGSDENKEQAFLIKTSANRPSGYGYYQYSSVSAGGQTGFQVVSTHYDHNLLMVRSTFWFDGSRKQFTWKTSIQQARMGTPRDYTLVQEPDGTVTVSTNFDTDVRFQCSGTAVAEVLLPEYAALLLDNGESEAVVVDVIASTGFVVPTVIERMAIEKTQARAEQIASAIRINFLNNRDSFEELYFDAAGRLIGRYEQLPSRKRLWERTTTDTLKQIFKDNFQPANDIVAVVITQ